MLHGALPQRGRRGSCARGWLAAPAVLMLCFTWGVLLPRAGREVRERPRQAGTKELGVEGEAQAACTPVLRLGTEEGAIDVVLNGAAAPKAVAHIAEFYRDHNAQNGTTGRAEFYRNEAVPGQGEPKDGPPYSLLQGRIPGALLPELESSPTIARGDVVHITSTGAASDFFISLGPHPDWAASFTVFGRVTDFATAERIVALPHRIDVHPTHKVQMRMLIHPIPIEPTVVCV